MALDFNLVGQQVKLMGGALHESVNDRNERIEQARAALREQAARWSEWRDLAAARYDKSPWLLAAPAEPLDERRPLPPAPPIFETMAAHTAA